MSNIISAENIGKRYEIGHTKLSAPSLRESVSEFARSPFRKLFRDQVRSREYLWALKDINFDVADGEVVGLIGRNGSGKSTLLKLISQITEPTTGRIQLHGRVGSLIEVGTGFHPELTGRENIYMNGAILGMRRAEIKRKFDEIVSFSELEKFIETPVKHYSSGMYVRLAFSVAVHLEPDILLIDEVLAVGDMAFQQKCLQKIRSMRELSKAIILVSHSTIAVKAICSRAILLDRGQIAATGTPGDIIPMYERTMIETPETDTARREEEEGLGAVSIRSIKLLDRTGTQQRTFETGEPIRVVVEYDAKQKIEGSIIYAAIRRPDGFICVGTSTKLENVSVPTLDGPGIVEIEIPELLVTPDFYVMDVTFYDENFEHRVYFYGRKRTGFDVRSKDSSLDSKYGVVYQKQNWRFHSANGR
jgi:homopolymeric O-antigen transport system ATP-binding protein